MNEENWKPVPGYEDLYEASDLGNIRSLNYNHTGKTRVLKPMVAGDYLHVRLCKNGKKKSFWVHRLVYEAFRGPIPKGMQVNHLNEIKSDNRLSNLELVTAKQNMNWGTRNERAAASNRGRKHTEETKAKMRASQKARHQREKHGN